MDPRTHLPVDCPPLKKRFTVSSPVASMRRLDAWQSPQDTQLLHGDIFLAYIIECDWAWGQSESPIKNSVYSGYVGYVNTTELSEHEQKSSHVVESLKAPVFLSHDIKSRVLKILPLGARVSGVLDGDFLKTLNGYIHTRHVRALDETPTVNDFVAVAERFLGLPYIWGGVSPDGLDCSGLVLSGLRASGRDSPRDSDMQSHMGDFIDSDTTLQRGDLIFWKGHVGIMRDAETLLHANAYHMCVASEPLSVANERIKKTAGSVTARRRIL